MVGQSLASIVILVNCRTAGLSQQEAYSSFLNGKTASGDSDVALSDYLDRGYSLLDLQKKWLSVWDPED
jgi:hypothetical protein